MKLQDARKLTVRQRVRLRFRLRNGMECVIDEHGVSRVPELREPPQFNLEEEFAAAESFTLEPAAGGAARPITRQELETLVGAVARVAAIEPGEE
ncbi:MAG: hypothetical protein RMK57_12320 [Bryobacterales bacterium]|nr:hypothetical protein [Bryobacteraceae bacterium]MDW8355305.1 hypothetical protein [Bryobacterales bacterium]